MSRASGFALLELMMAMAITLTIVGSVFSLLNPAQGSFVMEPELADLQQRLRVAQDTIYQDLIMAGAGAYTGEQTGSLLYFFPPVLPFRPDANGEALADTITLVYVPATAGQTTLAQPVTGDAGGTTLLKVASGDGFKPGMTVLVFDYAGNYDTFTIKSVSDTTTIVANRHHSSDLVQTVFSAGAKVVEAVNRTYYFKRDTNQLISADRATGPDVPVVDNIVDLSFEYWGDPNPPKRNANALNSAGPWMTYGPAPTIAENCLIRVDQGRQIERLPTLPSGSNVNALVRLTGDQLTDGSLGWCPTDSHSNRYSPNLFRIRKIAVTVRVQAALAAMRGPASALFRVGGTSRSATGWIPDQQVSFEVCPRNMNLGR